MTNTTDCDRLVCIGICGKPGSGKDTAGGYVSSACGFRRMTLKEPIERTVEAILQVDHGHLYDRALREQPLDAWPGWTVRKALQSVGQAMREAFGEHVWARSLCMRMGNAGKFVVTDVRTPGDVAQIRQHVGANGGRFFLWGIRRPGCGATTSGGFANHVLESYDLESECDAVFHNDGTVEDLLRKVVAWLSDQGIRSLSYESDLRIFEAINSAVEAKYSALDTLQQPERAKFCWCKPGMTHCGTCDCGKPGHMRSLGPATFCWCDACYEEASKMAWGRGSVSPVEPKA